ncbi:MAG: hypothetical protein V9G14_12310 [Cypionkella sp.]
MAVTVRDATAADETVWRRLWEEFLAYYGVNLTEAVTDHTWGRLMLPACALKARLAEVDGVVVGFAIHQHHPSTWVLGDDCYLEDLFVCPEFAQSRGRARPDRGFDCSGARPWLAATVLEC